MNKLTTIKQLITHLSECNREDLNNVYQLIDIPKEAFKPYQSWKNNRYTRNCIVKTDEYELLLLCWEKDQSAAIHAHDNQECWVYDVEGEFEENRYQFDDNNELHVIKKDYLGETDYSYMTDNLGYHDLRNSFNGRSISLHLYAKPIQHCNVFNANKKCFELKELKYDSIDGHPTVHFQN